ncbi:MAG: transcription termination/antitermination protein NusG [Planctomycetaceae bacterium]
MNDNDPTVPGAAIEPAEMQWYVLKVQTNRERSIKDSLVRRIKMEGMQEFFKEILIPTEKVVETKGGKRKVREQKLYPGYMMVEMRLTDESWHLVRSTNGVGDFTGAAGKPVPMQQHEVERLFAATQVGVEPEEEKVQVKFHVAVGDVVKVKEGPFESFEGSVDSLDAGTGKVKVLIEIFGRSTEVELEHWQVEKA